MPSPPVALFLYNRPNLARHTFARIAAARPEKLLIVADGPRQPSDAARCEETRALIDQVDWPCELLTDLADENLGCARRIATGLDWVFRCVESAILLEDDCVPAPEFFPFCAELLQRFCYDDRVMMIGGSCPIGRWPSRYSYTFSKHALIWGWATWRRAWQHYDPAMSSWPELRATAFLGEWLDVPEEEPHWRDRFDRAYGGHSTWDHQWTLTCWRRRGLVVLPSSNLVTNIGFGPDAEHTRSPEQFERLSVPCETLRFPLIHPSRVERNRALDRAIFRRVYAPVDGAT